MHTPGGEIWQGIAGPGVNLQKLRQAKQITAVVLEGERGSESWRQRREYVLRSGAGTKEAQQPRDLEVWDRTFVGNSSEANCLSRNSAMDDSIGDS